MYGLGRHDLGDLAVDLETVVVQESRQVVQLVVGRRHGSFPDLSFLQLAVSQDRIDPVILLIKLACEGHAHRG